MTWFSAPAGGAAAKLAKSVATNPKVRKEVARQVAKSKVVQTGVKTIVIPAAKKGYEAVTAKRSNRSRSQKLARQVRGLYSEGTIVAGRERFVVWKDGEPVDCFPPLTDDELNGAGLADRWELREFDSALLKDPPQAKTG